MPLEDALAVCAEEGRVYKHDIAGKLFNKRFTRWFPNGVTPARESELYLLFASRIPGELKHLSNRRKINHMRFPE